MLNEAEVNEYAARQLRALRATSGYSQTKLARKMNMSPQQVQKYEWGINRLSVGRLAQFAEAFDVSVAIFLPDTGKDYPCDPVPQPTVRFIHLIGNVNPKHYDLLYVALKAIVRMCSGKAGN